MPNAWESRFAAYLTRLLAVRERTSFDVLPDLMPVMPVCNPDQIEFRRHRGERMFSGGVAITAAGGQLPHCECGISAAAGGPGTLMVIERMIVSVQASQQVQFQLMGPGLTLDNPAALSSIDARETGILSGQVGSLSAVGGFAIGRQMQVIAGNTEITSQWVIPRGYFLSVQGQNAASYLAVIFLGYERSNVQDPEQRRGA